MEDIPVKPKSPPPELLMLLCALERLVARNNRLTSVYGELDYKNGLSAFMVTRTPTIALQSYLERIHRFADLDPPCFIIAYVYIDRTVHAHPDLIVASMNVHRLTLASLLLASKVLDDMHHSNAFFARIGGISNAEMNKLELELLFLLSFRVNVSASVFQRYHSHMEMEMARSCATEKNYSNLNAFREDVVIISKDEDHIHRWPSNGLNHVSMTNGTRMSYGSRVRHSFNGR